MSEEVNDELYAMIARSCHNAFKEFLKREGNLEDFKSGKPMFSNIELHGPTFGFDKSILVTLKAQLVEKKD